MRRRPGSTALVAALVAARGGGRGVAAAAVERPNRGAAAGASAVAVTVATVEVAGAAGHARSDRQLRGRRSRPTSPRTRPGASSPRRSTLGQFVKEGAVLVRLQGVDAGLRLDEARAAVSRAEANLKLAESQNTLAQTTAQRYASLLATGDVSSTVADQARTTARDLRPERQHRARLAGPGHGAARARRKGGRRRRGRRAVLRLHQPAPRLARRVRAALDCCRHAAQDRPAPPATDDSRRPGRPRPRRPDRHGDGRRLSRSSHSPAASAPSTRRFRRRRDRSASRRGCRILRRSSSPACSPWRPSIRAGR